MGSWPASRGAVGRAGHLGHSASIPPASRTSQLSGSLESLGNAPFAARTNGQFDSVLNWPPRRPVGSPTTSKNGTAHPIRLDAGVASIINVLDPETIIIGGGIAAPATHCRPLATARSDGMAAHGHQARIVRHALGENYAGAIGAGRNAMLSNGSIVEAELFPIPAVYAGGVYAKYEI